MADFTDFLPESSVKIFFMLKVDKDSSGAKPANI
jgi:hypothetical protein